jgi:hypothetical protein
VSRNCRAVTHRHVTIGDLIRDEKLAVAAAEGASAAAEARWRERGPRAD